MKNNACRVLYNGQQDCDLIQTSETVVGNEVGWDYFNHVSNGKMPLTKFCSIMNGRYGYMSSFMSRQHSLTTYLMDDKFQSRF